MPPSDLFVAPVDGLSPARHRDLPLDLRAEREAVRAAVRTAHVAVVRGGAGLGKTTLLSEVIGSPHADARSTRLVVDCGATDDRPLGTIATLAERLLASPVAHDVTPDQSEALHHLAGFASPGGRSADASIVALCELLGSPGAPIRIGVDDIHLAGPLTRRVFRDVTDRAGAAASRTRVVVTERVEPGTDPSIGFGWLRHPETVLHTWDAIRIADHLRTHLGEVPTLASTSAWIERSSAGLPRYVAALCNRTIRTYDEMAEASRHHHLRTARAS